MPLMKKLKTVSYSMSLFNDTDDIKKKRSKKKYTPLNSLKMRQVLYKEFATALQHRDERLLNFLLSDKQESKHWTTKQDFIDKYLTACKKLESRQPITITVHRGIGRHANFSWQYGVCVIADSTKEKKRLWKFDLVFCLDEFGKVKISKARAVYFSSAFDGQPTNELFKELPHPSCSPPKPKFSFK